MAQREASRLLAHSLLHTFQNNIVGSASRCAARDTRDATQATVRRAQGVIDDTGTRTTSRCRPRPGVPRHPARASQYAFRAPPRTAPRTPTCGGSVSTWSTRPCATARCPAVGDAAARFGFFNPGRFAAEYRQVFDENPGQTLVRPHRPEGWTSLCGCPVVQTMRTLVDRSSCWRPRQAPSTPRKRARGLHVDRPCTPLPNATPVQSRSAQPLEGKARARRTDAIVCDLRGVHRQADTDELTRQLIETNVAVARSMASRYRNRGIDLDDLEQVALLGLTKAAQRFDPSCWSRLPVLRRAHRSAVSCAGTSATSGWMVRPPRRIQDLQTRIAAAQEELESRLGRSPRPSEIAAHLGEQTLRRRGGARRGRVLHADLAGRPGRGRLVVARRPAGRRGPCAGPGRGEGHARPADARPCTARDRRIVRLRYYQEQTQQEIADSVGLTQAQVSRVLTRILTDLRAGLVERPPAA